MPSTPRLCEPELAIRRVELATAVTTRNRLADELKVLSEQIRTLKNDIDLAGGQRLRDLPGLIREEKTAHDAKDQASQRYHAQLTKCGIQQRVETPKLFATMRQQLQTDLKSTRRHLETLGEEHEEQLAQRAVCSRQIQEEQSIPARNGADPPPGPVVLLMPIGTELHVPILGQSQPVDLAELFDGVAAAEEFPSIVESLGDPALSIADLFMRRQQWPELTRKMIEGIRADLQPITEKLIGAMNKFLREFKEEQADLDASVQTLESFLQLLHQIREEDLPRHEKKFKDRLNDKVSQEVALLNGALRQECKHIEEKVRQLNVALASLDFQTESNGQPATYMKLEPREVNDRDITEFRRALRECLDESLENTDEANEARFLRIKKLVDRLADKENTRWRDKVIDVRYWFDFAAREVQRSDGKTRSYYEDSAGQSGGEKAKLAFTILVAALAYQFDIDPSGKAPGRLQFVVVDEMFSKVDDHNAQYALKLFQQFGLQLLIVAPLDAKARVTEFFVDCYLHAVKDESTHCSELYSMTAREYEEVLKGFPTNGKPAKSRVLVAK